MFGLIDKEQIEQEYGNARKVYKGYGIDTEAVMKKAAGIPVSVHCWQGDDVAGFESGEGLSGGGILATGNYPGRARNGDELRADFEKAMSLFPGTKKFNLHAIYRETGGKNVERDSIEPEHFSRWIEWAQKTDIALDFNPSYFSHPMAESGFTLASKDKKVRDFWIRHSKKCREIANTIGKELGKPCVNNFWIIDGTKDYPADRYGHRVILTEALDEIFENKLDPACTLDAVESKLFGIGSEAYVVGSHEYYLGYALSRGLMLTMDAGHYHPTEEIADKISALLPFTENLLLHVSRPMRWDSDHVVLFDDVTRRITQEIKRAGAYGKVHVALDFFDASINRISAWVIGSRATQKAILYSLLEPTDLLVKEELAGNFGGRMAISEELKTLPFSAVWNKYCLDAGVPVGSDWLTIVTDYEETTLSKRNQV